MAIEWLYTRSKIKFLDKKEVFTRYSGLLHVTATLYVSSVESNLMV